MAAPPSTKDVAIANARVLVVGAGGIGCELLKTLVLTGFKNIHLIDMDTIDVSNLNRQFLFRKRHVGQSKAKVASEAVLKMRSGLNIIPHHGNIKDSEFGVEFFKNFDVVLNGLDNVEARRHVNRLCLATSVPLVESGTTGYLGQVSVHIKGKTMCYECEAKPVPKTFPTCTITSTPSKPVHCVVWAKELPFLKLFGPKELPSDLDHPPKSADENPPEEENDFFVPKPGENLALFAQKIFNRIFGENVAKTLEMEDLWKTREKPKPLFLKDVFPGLDEHGISLLLNRASSSDGVGTTSTETREETGKEEVNHSKQNEKEKPHNGAMEHDEENDESDESARKRRRIDENGMALGVSEKEVTRTSEKEKGELQVSAMTSLSLKNSHVQWTIEENAKIFLESICLFFEKRSNEIGFLTFDKDDQLSVEFVTSASNLRCHSFSIPTSSLFEAKGIAGNIVHAIATTNAIIAGLIVIQAVKIVRRNLANPSLVYVTEFANDKGRLIQSSEMLPPNPICYVCSKSPLALELDTKKTKFKNFVDKVVCKKLCIFSPIIMYDNNVLYETGEGLEEDEITFYQANLEKLFCDFSNPIKDGSILHVEDYQQQLSSILVIKHKDMINENDDEDAEMVLIGDLSSIQNQKLNVNKTNVNTDNNENNGGVDASDSEDDLIMIENPQEDDDDDLIML